MASFLDHYGLIHFCEEEVSAHHDTDTCNDDQTVVQGTSGVFNFGNMKIYPPPEKRKQDPQLPFCKIEDRSFRCNLLKASVPVRIFSKLLAYLG